MPPLEVSRPLLLGLLIVGAVVALVTPQPTSSFAAGFVVGAGSVFVVSFVRSRRPEGPADDGGGGGA